MSEVLPATLLSICHVRQFYTSYLLRIDLGSSFIREASVFVEVTLTLAQHMVVYGITVKARAVIPRKTRLSFAP